MYVVALFSLILTPVFAHAALENPLSFDSLEKFFNALLDVVVTIGWPLVVLAVVYTGFLFVQAQGNASKLDDAKRALVWTVIGGLIVLGATAIATFIGGTVDELR